MKIFRNLFFSILFIISSMISLQAQDVVITDITTTPVTCGGASDGTVTVTVTGGIGPYSYLLAKGAVPVESAGPIASQTFTFTGHDKYVNYWVIVSDASPATADDWGVATIGGPDPISITSYLATDITCNGANDGTITVTAIGEQGNFIFDLAGPVVQGNETGVFTGLPQGDYTVTVSDKDGCFSTDVTPVMTINNPSPVSVIIDNVTNVTCYGEFTGSITITPIGGTPGGMGSGYTYLWSGPGGFSSTNEDINNLEAGEYSVTVYDGNMCTGNAGPLTVGQPPQITVTLDNTTDVTCNGGNDGAAEISPTGGVGGYTFLWDGQSVGPVSTDEDPVNLVADTYDLTITDGNGCSRTFVSFATINEPAPFTITLDGQTEVSCSGGNDGTANITPGGGTPPYTFLWSGAISGYSSTDEDPVNMPADDYSVTITDSRGCSQLFAAFLTITEPPPLSVVLNGFTDVTCFGGSDGTADITISGGTPPYTISWAGDATAHSSSMEDPNDLVADTYDLTITDDNGCILNLNDLVTINEPGDLMVTINQVIHVDCYGDFTGSINITPSGGTPVYGFAWSGPNGFSAITEDISNLEVGVYDLTLSDANGCSKDFPGLVTINQNPAITATFNLTDVTCNGGSDGSIDATVSGGVSPYIFDWTGPSGFSATTEDISGLRAGDYVLTVTDVLSCVQVMPAQTLSEPPPINASATHVDIDCYGAGNGSIDLTPSGGTAPYSFDWSGPSGFTASTEDISGLEAGDYSVTITDANLCSQVFTDIVTILEPAEIQISSVITDISCNGLTDGAIDITVTGGTLPYSFAWSGPSGFSSGQEDISGLEAGDYDLTITDGNGCVANFNVGTVVEPLPINATYVSHQNVLCTGDANGSIQIDVTGGTPPLTFDWTNSSAITQSTDEDPTGLPAEVYSLTITDNNGCSAVYPDMVTITEPPPLSSTLVGTDITCFAAGDGIITVTAAGGTAPYEYSITSDAGPYQPGNVFTSLDPGPYTVWARDANLCLVSDMVTLNEPSEIQILGETVTGVILCYGDSTAQISIDGVTGGVSPYEYSINGGIDYYTSSTFTNVPAGNYQTMVRDATGCTVPGDLNVISQPVQIQIDSYSQDDITTCYDALEGRITIGGIGGTGTITYTLDGSVQNLTGDFQNLPGGAHIVTLEDDNGCTLDTTVVILAPPEIVIDFLTINDVTGCNGDSNGSVMVTASGGTGTLQYSINGIDFQLGGTFTNMLAGPYTISVKDDNDCTRDTLINVAEPAPLTIVTETATDITCAGSGDGTIEIVAGGGTAPYTFTLNPGAISNGTGIFSGLNPGTYTVSVDDTPGCGPVNSSPLSITEPPPLVIDSLIDNNITCNGLDNGNISIYVSGGVPPYAYSIDNQGSWSPDSIFTDLIPATYEVYIRDANLCIIYGGSYTMTDPPPLSLAVTTIDINTCYGDTIGEIDALGSGGTGVLEYSLDGIQFQSSGTFNNLAANSYTVYVRDEAGCLYNESATVNEPAPVLANISKTDATYGNLGSITISGTTGGTPPYEYTIGGDTGIFTTDTIFTDLEAATYHVIIQDQNGCRYQEMVDILDVPPLDVILNITPVSCFGADDGSIEFVPQDAEGAVEYSIDSGMNFVSTPLFENLPGNTTYYLVAQDTAGKVFSDSVFLTEPTEIFLSRIITPAECNAFSNTGAVDITVSGGSGTYSFLWSDGITIGDRTNILAGTYVLETLDSDGCYRFDTITVNSQVIVTVYAGEDTTICYGETIQLNGQGGHIPSWEPAAFLTDTAIANPVTLPITQSVAFVLTITEETSPYGCYNTDTITVTPYPLTGIDVTADTFVIRGTSIQLEAAGGPFSAYRWEPSTGLDNSTIFNPLATPEESIRYYVYGTNTYGCEEVDSVFVEVLEDLQIFNVFSPNGDGVNDYFEIENSERFPDMLVEIYSRWGDQLYSTVGYDSGSQWDGTARGKDAPVGTYYYVIIPYSGAKPITGNVTIIR